MPVHDTVRIPLRGRDGTVRAYAIVDAADAAFATQWHWYLNDNGYVMRDGRIDGHRTSFRLHRELLGLKHGDGMEGDHIDRNRLNNRRNNLRVLPREGRANMQNHSSCKGSTSKFRGVSWDSSRGKWVAQAKIPGRKTFLGYFVNEEDAANAAREARLKHMPYAVD